MWWQGGVRSVSGAALDDPPGRRSSVSRTARLLRLNGPRTLSQRQVRGLRRRERSGASSCRIPPNVVCKRSNWDCATRGGDIVIDIVDLISDLRMQLDQAQAAAAGERLQFALGPIELELTVAISAEASGNAKVRIYVLEVGGGGTSSETSTQKIKLTLTPRIDVPAATDATRAQTEAALSQALIYVTGKQFEGER